MNVCITEVFTSFAPGYSSSRKLRMVSSLISKTKEVHTRHLWMLGCNPPLHFLVYTFSPGPSPTPSPFHAPLSLYHLHQLLFIILLFQTHHFFKTSTLTSCFLPFICWITSTPFQLSSVSHFLSWSPTFPFYFTPDFFLSFQEHEIICLSLSWELIQGGYSANSPQPWVINARW